MADTLPTISPGGLPRQEPLGSRRHRQDTAQLSLQPQLHLDLAPPHTGCSPVAELLAHGKVPRTAALGNVPFRANFLQVLQPKRYFHFQIRTERATAENTPVGRPRQLPAFLYPVESSWQKSGGPGQTLNVNNSYCSLLKKNRTEHFKWMNSSSIFMYRNSTQKRHGLFLKSLFALVFTKIGSNITKYTLPYHKHPRRDPITLNKNFLKHLQMLPTASSKPGT